MRCRVQLYRGLQRHRTIQELADLLRPKRRSQAPPLPGGRYTCCTLVPGVLDRKYAPHAATPQCHSHHHRPDRRSLCGVEQRTAMDPRRRDVDRLQRVRRQPRVTTPLEWVRHGQ